ncbi:hypothetical protein [Cupriavidus sp. TMH.W2]|uniref:hypothetical protein n=1 Tax=Cupriavidus sp. TMH.W2 TaxID=3434465 RepID=UPI003D76C215
MPSKEEGHAWVQSVVNRHLPLGTRHYSAFVYAGGLVSNSFGGESDPQPQEGKVVEHSDHWVLLKVDQTSVFVVPKELLETVPEIGATVRITPYARRRFDGTRLDALAAKDAPGNATRAIVIGEARSELPVDKNSISSPLLKEMIEQVEARLAPDGMRTLAQVLIDAGAANRPVGLRDPSEVDEIAAPPTLQFHIDNTRFKGMLNIVFHRVDDCFRVQLAEYGSWAVVKETNHVPFSALAEVLTDLVDDGKWRIAKVEVLKPAPRRTKAAG